MTHDDVATFEAEMKDAIARAFAEIAQQADVQRSRRRQEHAAFMAECRADIEAIVAELRQAFGGGAVKPETLAHRTAPEP